MHHVRLRAPSLPVSHAQLLQYTRLAVSGLFVPSHTHLIPFIRRLVGMLTPRRAVGGACALLFLLLCLVAFTADAGWSLRSSSNFVMESELCAEVPHMDMTSQGLVDRPVVAEESVKRKHIAIASVFGFHFDVYMALAWTLERILDKVPDSELQVFADPFYYGFQSVVDGLGLYHGPRNNREDFIPYLRNNPALDMVVLGTCEVECVSDYSSRLTRS